MELDCTGVPDIPLPIFYTKCRRTEKRYAELERRYLEAEQTEQWDRAERIGEALVEMEQHSGFKQCFSCGRKGCPAHFDGFVSWEPMDSSCKTLPLTVFN